jgi:MFS family permease
MFFGWYIVGANALFMAFYGWAVIYGFSTFVNPVSATFGWSYTQISLAMSIRGMETGILNPLFGAAVDRWPARKLAVFGMVVFGAGFLLLSRTQNLAMFYIGSLIFAFGSSLAVNMVPMAVIARWFKKDIGKANGIVALGAGLGGTFIPALVLMIDSIGWQNAFLILAICIWVAGIPLSFLFYDRPDALGLHVDGKPPEKQVVSNANTPNQGKGNLRELIKSKPFWYIGIASLCQMAAMNAAVVHMMPYFTSIGIERSKAGFIVMLVPLTSLPVRIPFGMLADRFEKKKIMAMNIGLLGFGTYLMIFVSDTSTVINLLFAVMLGMGMGGFMPIRSPIIREYFGTQNFGTILGLTSIFITIGAVVSPTVTGWVYDTWGTYYLAWLGLGSLAMLGALIMLLLPAASVND